MTTGQAYSPQLSFDYEVEKESYIEKTQLNHISEGISCALPPSFASFLTNCCSEVKQGRYVAPATVGTFIIILMILFLDWCRRTPAKFIREHRSQISNRGIFLHFFSLFYMHAHKHMVVFWCLLLLKEFEPVFCILVN